MLLVQQYTFLNLLCCLDFFLGAIFMNGIFFQHKAQVLALAQILSK